MAEDMAARWREGFWNVIAEVQRRIRVAKELKPVRVKVLGDFSHLYLRNGVVVQVSPGSNRRSRRRSAIALTARGFQRL
jgi:hypothetical protein